MYATQSNLTSYAYCTGVAVLWVTRYTTCTSLDNLVKSTKPMGGGGTDVNCVTQYMADEGIKPQACIVLTDGYLYSGWGDWTCPVLWAILDNKSAVPDEGKAVHIKSRDML